MRIVVIGGTGRIGEFVVRELLNPSDGGPGHSVTVVSRAGGTPIPGAQYALADVLDLGQTIGAVAGADAIIQLAAVTRRRGVAVNDVIFRGSVQADFNVHEAAWRMGIKKVVSCGSGSALGWDYAERPFLPDYLPIDEAHPRRPQDAYGLAKDLTERIAESYAAKGTMTTAVLSPSKVCLPPMIEQMHQQGGDPITGFNTYTYTDVRDLAVAFRLAVEKPLEGYVPLYIVADDSRVSEPLCDLLPRVAPEIGDMARALTGTRAAISNARAKQVLGWQHTRTWR